MKISLRISVTTTSLGRKHPISHLPMSRNMESTVSKDHSRKGGTTAGWVLTLLFFGLDFSEW